MRSRGTVDRVSYRYRRDCNSSAVKAAFWPTATVDALRSRDSFSPPAVIEGVATKPKFVPAFAGLALLLVSQAAGGGSTAVSDGVLSVLLPRPWSGSVGPGAQLVGELSG